MRFRKTTAIRIKRYKSLVGAKSADDLINRVINAVEDKIVVKQI